MNEKTAGHILNIVFGIIGYGLLLNVDWQIALGVFFVHWGINATMRSM